RSVGNGGRTSQRRREARSLRGVRGRRARCQSFRSCPASNGIRRRGRRTGLSGRVRELSRPGRRSDRRHPLRPRNLPPPADRRRDRRSEEHTSELQSRENLVCRLLLEKKKKTKKDIILCV